VDPFQTTAAIGSGRIVGFSLGLIGGGSVLAVPCYDSSELCCLRVRRLAHRASVHCGRDRRRMVRRASREAPLGAAPDADAHTGRILGCMLVLVSAYVVY
jgi:hypothetical protein